MMQRGKRMQRRQLVQAAALATVSVPLMIRTTAGHARQTSGSEPSQLVARVESVAPEILLEGLLTTPVTTPLFPSDTLPVEPVVWDDDGDSDLAGTVGAVAFNAVYDNNDSFVAVGNAMVHPDTASASAFFILDDEPAPDTFLGLPWVSYAERLYAISAVQIGYLILVGGIETWDEDNVASAESGTPPASVSGNATLALRAISNMTALLDHLDAVLTELGA